MSKKTTKALVSIPFAKVTNAVKSEVKETKTKVKENNMNKKEETTNEDVVLDALVAAGNKEAIKAYIAQKTQASTSKGDFEWVNSMYVNTIGKDGLKVGIKVEDFVEFLTAHVNDRGYVNLSIWPKKHQQEGRSTHSVKFDAKYNK